MTPLTPGAEPSADKPASPPLRLTQDIDQYIREHTTPERIVGPWAHHQLFVFGSNLRGIHGAGAALTARKYWGAMQGKGKGFSRVDYYSSASWALPTKEAPHGPVLPLEEIQKHVDLLSGHVNRASKDWQILITAVGCGLAGYTAEQIAPLFADLVVFPNVFLPKSFWAVLRPRLQVTTLSYFGPRSERDYPSFPEQPPLRETDIEGPGVGHTQFKLKLNRDDFPHF